MIRPMAPADIDAVADLAQSARLLEASWQPQLWSPSSGARGVHPLVLRRQLDGGLPALVAEEPAGLVGAIVPTESTGCEGQGAGAAWAVDDFFVASPGLWDTIGRALLVGLAGRAAAAGVERLIVSCGGSDDQLRRVLRTAGLTPTGWVRVRDLVTARAATPVGVRRATEADAAAVATLLSRAARHEHNLRPAPAAPTAEDALGEVLVLDDRGVIGVAVVGPSLPPPPGHEPRQGTALAEPIVLDDRADWTNDGARLVRGVEWLATGRDDAQVVIPCVPAEARMDEELGSAGYAIRLEWWTLDVDGRRGSIAVRPA